jgi:hypothetical protein
MGGREREGKADQAARREWQAQRKFSKKVSDLDAKEILLIKCHLTVGFS